MSSKQSAATEPTAVLPLVGQTGVFDVLLCILVVIVPISIQAADYVEITIELNSTWRSQTRTNHHGTTARCIVGSNDWHISGDFLRNAKVDYWLVGTNVIEHRIITSSMYIEQAKDFVSEKILGQKPRLMAGSYPRAGETFTTIHPSPIGQPAFHGMEGVVWLAFCSGNYLKQVGRQIPMPIGPSSLGFGYSDKTVLFDDDFGLPRSVELFATNGTLVCEYKVLKATNYLGRTFPLEFQVIQRGQPAGGRARSSGSQSDLRGRVTSIRLGKPPELPDEVRKKLEP